MPSIHATYKFHILPVPSEEYRTTTKYLKTDPLIIKRPIGRPKIHTRKRDLMEDLIEGDKLKKTFRVTCSKCGEKGHNFKTYKGAPANPNWKTQDKKDQKRIFYIYSVSEIQISQSVPALEVVPNSNQSQEFQSPASEAACQGLFNKEITDVSKRRFRTKQPIRKKVPSCDPTPSTTSHPPKSPLAGLSKETMTAAVPEAQSIWQFMPTPGIRKEN
ncbi:hypothetical protein PIB30_048827 [Stylosanthes scabra]|uniref:Uncharacterized protein n=1 Tax=Stylosanthes scabra TaxID=79078 RepID=A0ABU6SIN4_9FABA|nr:hypothetical protein [Stylosanthes scabra]